MATTTRARRQARGSACCSSGTGTVAQGIARIAGVDEVGVGPLAGPVVAAAVVLPPDDRPRGVDDSKRLSAARERRRTPRSAPVPSASVSASWTLPTSIA